jgi:hypothetical protein
VSVMQSSRRNFDGQSRSLQAQLDDLFRKVSEAERDWEKQATLERAVLRATVGRDRTVKGKAWRRRIVLPVAVGLTILALAGICFIATLTFWPSLLF